MSKYNIMFNGVIMPHFMSVVKVENSILPEVSQNTVNIPGRPGSYFFSNEIGVRQIDVDIIIFGKKPSDLPRYAKEVAKWLYHDKPVKLEFSDRQGAYYLASFTGGSAIEELSRVGKATLSFVCFDPFMYGAKETIKMTSGGTCEVKNLGTAPSYPKITMTCAKNLTSFSIISSEEYISMGKSLGVQDKPKPNDPWIDGNNSGSEGGDGGDHGGGEDHGDGGGSGTEVTLGDWTQSTTTPLGRGVTVDLQKDAWDSINGAALKIKDNSWKKSGTQWHGGCLERDWGKTVQDFEFLAPVCFDGTPLRSIGMMQTNVRDSSNRPLLSIVYTDDTLDDPRLRIEVILYDVEGRDRVIFSKNLFGYGSWFIGGVRVRRKGNTWSVVVEEKVDKKDTEMIKPTAWQEGGGLSRRDSINFVDINNSYNSPARKTQIGIFMWENHQPTFPLASLTNPMMVYNVFVKELTDIAARSYTNNEYLMYKNDVITIDCEEGAIYRNGEHFMNFLAPKSTFIKLDMNKNFLNVSPVDGYKKVEVEITPKWF